MTISRVLAYALFAASSTAFAATAWQPTRNVEIVVSTSPGSGSDTTARFIQKLLIEKGFVRAPVTVTHALRSLSPARLVGRRRGFGRGRRGPS